MPSKRTWTFSGAFPVAISGLIAAVLPGCSDGLPSLANLSVPGLATSAVSSLGAPSEQFEPPVEIYSRIARGALRCWFGTEGSLKKSHVFHAEVGPASAGGGAEIAIYERDKSGQAPHAIRAFRITIARAGEGSHVQAENYRMPEPVAQDMGADVGRWGQGREGCSVVGLGGWAAEPVKDQPKAEPAKPAKAGKPALRPTL